MSITKVTYAMISGAAVNAKDFGAVGDGTTDDSAAIQAALDYCLANGNDLVISGLCRLATPLKITRGQTAPFAKYFTIRSDDGGGFYISTAMAMFSSNEVFTVDPVAFLINFQNLLFKGLALNGQYVLDDGRYARCTFNMCSFQSVQFAYVVTGRIQSVYLNSCQGRYTSQTFLRTDTFTFDLRVDSCLFEAGAEWFKLKNVNSASITNSCLEGNGTYSPVIVENAEGLLIEGCYFEQNGYHISLLGDHFATNINSNYYINAVAGYDVTWPANAFKCNSQGSYSNGVMHLLNTSSQVNILDYTSGASISNITPTTLSLGVFDSEKTIRNYSALTSGDTATLQNLGSSKFIVNDTRTISISTNFLSIAMGTTNGAIKINVVCSGSRAGVAAISQVSSWAVVRAGTGAFTITALDNTATAGTAPVAVTQSGDSILLGYVYGGASTNGFATSVEISVMSGAAVRTVPVVTIL